MKKIYQCPVCKLHYSTKAFATKCEKWCKEHKSCNLAITHHSLEAQKTKVKQEKEQSSEITLSIPKDKVFLPLVLALSLLAAFLLFKILSQQGYLAGFMKILRGNRVETGYITSGDYTQRIKDVSDEVLPKKGFKTKIVLGDVVPKMVSLGIIDMTKTEKLYQARGGLSKEQRAILTRPLLKPLIVTSENASWLVNILWALGLSNKMEINKKSPVNGPDLNNFASTGGWQLGEKKNGGFYFNKYSLITLSGAEEKRVQKIAESTYRPCCDNSSFFQDCNHGSAAMGLIELGVKKGLTDLEIYQTLLAFNSFWFPQNYLETALYFNVIKNTDWIDVDPKLVLSKKYSSITGFMTNVNKEVVKVPNLLPQIQGGGSCGV